jgi:hypothetical protein
MGSRILLARARHLLKTALPRNRSVLGVSFPDPAHTKSAYLELVGEEIYRVKHSESAVVTRSGVVRVGRNYLDVDYGAFAALDGISGFGRRGIRSPRVVALWSHKWPAFYHWLIDVAPKIATAKLHLGESIRDVRFAYPCAITSYHRETLELLGIDPGQMINPCESGELRSSEILVMPLPGWEKVSPRIFNLQRLLAPATRLERRLYISRTGRRKITNEAELFEMLGRYRFEFIEDRPRPLQEQMELFAAASHIVSPHGAALANIVWSNKSTQLLELADATYAPDYFVALASVLGQSLSRLSFGSGGSHWSNLENDFAVDVGRVREFLESHWGIQGDK